MKYCLIQNAKKSDNLIEQVLLNRGFAQDEIIPFLNSSIADTHSPLLLDNMHRGAQILVKHIAAGDKIVMAVDCDMDGYAAAALFINYLNCLFPNYAQTKIHYFFHQGKEHGIIEDSIDEETKLVVALDASSNEYELHKKLAEAGVDVLLADHHEAPETSYYACVINNQLCDYPNKSLSGAGVVYKFCCYLDSLLGVNYAPQFLDIVALALVGDMMDLHDKETFYYVCEGFTNIRNPYFSEMVERNARQFEGGITPMAVAFYVVPFVNAINRSGTQEEKQLIFESMLDFKAFEKIPSTKRGCKGQFETRVEQAGRTSINVKNRQKRAQDEGQNIIEGIIADGGLDNNKFLIVPIADGLVDRNLAGLIANQLAAAYQRPTMVLREVEGRLEGSARSYDKSGFSNMKDFLMRSGLMNWCEGHQSAFGASVDKDKLPALIDWINKELADISFDVRYDVDEIFDAKELAPDIITGIGNFAHVWGQGISEPLFAVENIKLTKQNMSFMGSNKRTLKINLWNNISAIQFNLSDEEIEELDPKDGYITLDLVGYFQVNKWNGMSFPQINIKDYAIVEKVEYDF